MTTQKKEYLTYDEVLTDMKVKISWHIDFIQRLKLELIQLMWDIYDDQKINEMASKIKKGKARVFREQNKDLLEVYKDKDKSLWESVRETWYINPPFAIDKGISEAERKNEGRKETIYDVLDSCGDYHTREMLLHKDIYNRQREKKWSVYQEKTSWQQMFSWEAVEELGLVNSLPSKEGMLFFMDMYKGNHEKFIKDLSWWKEDIFVWSISDTLTWTKNTYIRIFLSDGSTMTIYRFPEDEWKSFEFHEKDDSIVACSVCLKDKTDV